MAALSIRVRVSGSEEEIHYAQTASKGLRGQNLSRCLGLHDKCHHIIISTNSPLVFGLHGPPHGTMKTAGYALHAVAKGPQNEGSAKTMRIEGVFIFQNRRALFSCTLCLADSSETSFCQWRLQLLTNCPCRLPECAKQMEHQTGCHERCRGRRTVSRCRMAAGL